MVCTSRRKTKQKTSISVRVLPANLTEATLFPPSISGVSDAFSYEPLNVPVTKLRAIAKKKVPPLFLMKICIPVGIYLPQCKKYKSILFTGRWPFRIKHTRLNFSTSVASQRIILTSRRSLRKSTKYLRVVLKLNSFYTENFV